MRRLYTIVLISAFAACLLFSGVAGAKSNTPVFASKGKNVFTVTAPMNVDGKVNIIVTAPAGSTSINMPDLDKGVISSAGQAKYLPMPFNMAVLVRATLDKKPLPVVLLGEAATIGQVRKGLAIGVVEYTEQGLAQKMLIVVDEKSPFASVNNMEGLKSAFPGTIEIIQSWLSNAKGKDAVIITGIKDRLTAIDTVGDAILEYAKDHITEADRRPMDKDGNPTLLDYPASKNIRTGR